MNKNNKPFKMSDLYYEVNYHLEEKETVFTNPEKYGFVEVAMINANGFSIVTMQREAIDYFVVGYTGIPKKLFAYDKIDRSIINLPNTNNLVVIYNKYQEEEIKNNKTKPFVFIKENNTMIHSCCIVCRMDDNGNVSSVTQEDYNVISKYLAV
jgi:hypothetical protein